MNAPCKARPSRRRWTALLSLVLCLPTCGEPDVPTRTQGWPLQAPIDAVLGYLVESVPVDLLCDTLEGWVGWRPRGLVDGRPLVVALLDASVLGGHAALALPVADHDALRASLDACPNLEQLAGDRYVLRLPPDHELMQTVRIARSMVQARSLGDVLDAFGASSDTSLAWELHEGGEYALLVPSFEGAFVARKLLETLPLQRPEGLVASLDLEAVKLTYWTEIEDLENQVRGLLTGARTAGMAGLLGSAMGGGLQHQLGGAVGELPFARPWAWTLLTMLELDQLRAVQVSAESDGSVFTGNGAGLARQLRLRLAVGRDTPLGALLASLRPVSGVSEDAWVALVVEPEVFLPALRTWLMPLLAEAHGEGAPAEREADALIDLLAAWDGRLSAVETPSGGLLLAGSSGTRRLDAQGLVAWSAGLATALGLPVEGTPDAGDAVVADDVLLIGAGEADADDVEDALRAFEVVGPADVGPVLRMDFGDAAGSDRTRLELSLADDVLDLTVQLPESR